MVQLESRSAKSTFLNVHYVAFAKAMGEVTPKLKTQFLEYVHGILLSY